MHFISDECKIHRTHIRLFQLRSIHKSYIIAINSVYFYNQTEIYRFRLEFRVVEDPTVPRQPEWFLQRLLWSVLSSFAGFVVRIPTLKESVFSLTQELNYA